MRWVHTKAHMTCGMCKRIQEDGFRKHCDGIDYIEDCPTNEVYRLSDENDRFWELFSRTLPGLFNGWGGCNMDHVMKIFDLWEIPIERKRLFFDKALVAVRGIREAGELGKEK